MSEPERIRMLIDQKKELVKWLENKGNNRYESLRVCRQILELEKLLEIMEREPEGVPA